MPRTTHGDFGSKLYNIWASMKYRCNTPTCHAYSKYGGRGVTYCEEWETYEGFKAWAENAGYEEGLSIDRKNNDGNYCPDNCHWITRSLHARKTRCDSSRVRRDSRGQLWGLSRYFIPAWIF